MIRYILNSLTFLYMEGYGYKNSPLSNAVILVYQRNVWNTRDSDKLYEVSFDQTKNIRR